MLENRHIIWLQDLILEIIENSSCCHLFISAYAVLMLIVFEVAIEDIIENDSDDS